MPLIVEDGSGLPSAESYVSVAASDAYHAARANTGWAGDDAIKEAALRRATEFLDSLFEGRWIGRPAIRGQGLCWPRQRAYDAGLTLLPANIVPRGVIRATCEAALRELQSPGSLQPDVHPGERIVSETVGPLSVEYGDQGVGGDVLPVVTIVNRLVAPLLRSVAGAGLVLRA
ncbi:DnaT-like ssDNA-binding protein [Methylobacterium sp. JK268]